MTKHIVVLDSGTTSTRAVLFNDRSKVVAESSLKIAVHTPGGSRVEQDPNEIIANSITVLKDVLEQAKSQGLEVDSLVIANQRTATTFMDRATGKPVSVLIGWQDGRAQPRVDALQQEWGKRFARETAVNLAAANVSLHAVELLQDPQMRKRAEAGEIILGTPDTLMLVALAGQHTTSTSNASAYGALEFRKERWWKEWLDFLDVPEAMFPQILPDDADYGATLHDVLGVELPISAVVADQQSALFGHAGFDVGNVKCTHGTGSFVDFNVGTVVPEDSMGLDTRIGWRTSHHAANAIEGMSFVTGAAIEWLIDDMKMVPSASELDAICAASSNDSLIVVPALAGFASPYWDATARGTVFGLSRHTSDTDFVRATVNGVAHSVADLLESIVEISGSPASVLKVDGGLSRSAHLQQFTADLLQVPVERTGDAGVTTARGAAWIGGIARGVWASKEEAAESRTVEARFEPQMAEGKRNALRDAWKDAVQRSLKWKALEED
jgi:glycerol kinase